MIQVKNMAENEKNTIEETEKKPKGSNKKETVKKADYEALKEKLEAAESENAKLNDMFLRLNAEYDNFRKRSVKEKEGAYADAYSDCIANF